MTQADKYFIETCKEIIENGYSSEGTNVRTRWEDGTEANYISIVGVSNKYDVGKEFPMITLRNNTGTVKRAIDEVLWIWQKKSNNIKDLNSHIIYKNDESSFGINSPYCVAIQSYPFLVDGLKGLGGLSTAPKNIDSFCGMFVNLVFAVSSQFAGAVAIAGTFNMFDYYARKEWGDDYYLNDDKPARIKYGKDKEESISISKQIEQYFQQIV